MWRLGMQLRISITSLIYDKAVLLHMRSLLVTESSHIVNLSSQDVELFMQGGIFLHYLYVPILEALVILIFGIRELGVAFVVGFAAIMLLAPIQSFFSKAATRIRYVLASHTDARLRLISQAINGVRLMKINAWELAFKDIISEARRKEMNAIYNLSYIKAMNESLYFCTPVVVGAITFITYTQRGQDLTPQKIFTALTLFNIIQFDLTKFFPIAVQGAAQAYVATKRVQKLLLLEEINADQRENNHLPPSAAAGGGGGQWH
jgi:ATP-binding cassette subfamily C (CFTR/MRP) protein 4